jgi:predicted phosphodiesterase
VKRIGVISDPHGNLMALDAVLAELEREELDGLVCLGDLAVGPQPSETTARVMALDCPVVKGNWETWFCDGIPPPEDEIGHKLFEIGEFWKAQLSADELAVLDGLPATVEVDLGDGLRAVCFHGSPSSNEEGIYSVTPDETLEGILGEGMTPIVLCGHTHIQMLRRLEHVLVVNPGAIGLPFSEWAPHTIAIAPWAEYGIVTHDEGRLHVDLRRTTYDVAGMLDVSRSSGMPHAEWWADCWQLDRLRTG